MVLLIDNLENSGLSNLGPCIMKCLDEPCWEVRDSAVDLVTSIVEISKEKYPAFQKFILDNDILPVIVHMAKHDCEAYVRATALKCLSALVEVAVYKEKVFPTENLTVRLPVICSFFIIQKSVTAIGNNWQRRGSNCTTTSC